MNDEQFEAIESKQRDIQFKKKTTRNQTLADYLEGYHQGLQWCKENL